MKYLLRTTGLLLILVLSSCYVTSSGDLSVSTPYTKDADLTTLSVSSGTLSPAFSKNVQEYTLELGITASKIGLATIPVTAGVEVTVENNSEPVLDINNIDINLGQNIISVKVTSLDGTIQKSYHIIATRKISSQEAYIKASNADAGDELSALAIYGNTMVVAAGKEDSCLNGDGTNNSCIDSGTAYVFTRDINGAWTQEAELKASNSVAGIGFGLQSVDIYEDTIVVGANYESSNYKGIINVPGRPIAGDLEANKKAAKSGAAYVFVKDQDTGEWYQQAYIKGSHSLASDYFGHEVKLYKDTLAIAAPLDDSVAKDSGAIYIFERNNGLWSETAYLKASNAGAADNLGKWALAICDNTIVAGSYYESSNFKGAYNTPEYPTIAESNDLAVGSGAVYVFTKTNDLWSQTAFLKGSNTKAADRFHKVDIYKDTIVVGAPGEDSNFRGSFNTQAYPSVAQSNTSASASGAVYIFERAPEANGWMQKAYLKASNAKAANSFGSSVKIYKDTVVAAAKYESSDLTGVFTGTDFESNTNLTQSGALYVFNRDKNNKWQQSNYLKASNAKTSDSLSGNGTTTNIGISDGIIAVSTNYEDNDFLGIINEAGAPVSTETNTFAVNSGAVYVFH